MQYLEKICCFFVFARIFLHMCPNEKYEKYLSALTSWIAFCIFLSPFLSGDIVRDSYENWEREWQVRLEEQMDIETEGLDKESERATSRIVEEIEKEYEVGTDQ